MQERGVYKVVSSSLAFDTSILGSSFAILFGISWSW